MLLCSLNVFDLYVEYICVYRCVCSKCMQCVLFAACTVLRQMLYKTNPYMCGKCVIHPPEARASLRRRPCSALRAAS